VKAFLTAAIILLAGRSGADSDTPVNVRMDFNPRKITVGDQVKFTFTVESAAGIAVAPPSTATVFGDWEVLGYRELPAKTGDVSRSFEWIMTAWTTGKLTLPSPRFTCTGTGWKAGFAEAPPGIMEVESVLAGDKDPQDLKPPKGLIGYRNIWPYIWAALAVLGISFLIWWWQRRKKKLADLAAGIIPGVPVKPAEETAREALDELASSGLAETDVKVFYITLSDILRRYIEAKFGVSAMDRTTAELMPEIRRHSALASHSPEMRMFFEDCDLAKFAKYVPSADDIATDMGRARRVVDETAPRGTMGQVVSGQLSVVSHGKRGES